MLISILMVLISFAYSVKVIAQLPIIKHRNQRSAVSLVIPALLMFVGGEYHSTCFLTGLISCLAEEFSFPSSIQSILKLYFIFIKMARFPCSRLTLIMMEVTSIQVEYEELYPDPLLCYSSIVVNYAGVSVSVRHTKFVRFNKVYCSCTCNIVYHYDISVTRSFSSSDVPFLSFFYFNQKVLFSAVCALIGVVTFSVATHMDQGLYFPESLPPTWANSWAQVSKNRIYLFPLRQKT